MTTLGPALLAAIGLAVFMVRRLARGRSINAIIKEARKHYDDSFIPPSPPPRKVHIAFADNPPGTVLSVLTHDANTEVTVSPRGSALLPSSEDYKRRRRQESDDDSLIATLAVASLLSEGSGDSSSNFSSSNDFSSGDSGSFSGGGGESGGGGASGDW